MTLSEILRQAFATFRAHKMRTFLTMFGIVWGIASVIILVGLGRGFSVDQKKHMQTLGKDLVIMWGGRTSSQVGGRAAGREIHLSVDDADLIRDECYRSKTSARNCGEPFRKSASTIWPTGAWLACGRRTRISGRWRFPKAG